MLDINMNLYKVFYEVANSKTYNEASEKLKMTKSAISKNILLLEEQLGTSLFNREREGLRLNELGQKLFIEVEKSIKAIELGERLIIQNKGLEEGEITIGCPSHIANFYLIPKLEKLLNEYPKSKINIVSGKSSKELIKLLENHKIDIMIDSTDIEENNNLNIESIKELENIFVSKKEIKIENIKDLEKYRVILPYYNTNTMDTLDEFLIENDIDLKKKMQIDISELRIKLVKSGIGIAYVFKDIIEDELSNKTLYEIKLNIKLPVNNLKLIYNKGQLTSIAKEFIKKYIKK